MDVHLTDWTPDVALSTAAAAGLRGMGKQHWRAITACRELALQTGELPTIERVATHSGIDVEKLGRLFDDVTTLLPSIAGLTGRLPESLNERNRR